MSTFQGEILAPKVLDGAAAVKEQRPVFASLNAVFSAAHEAIVQCSIFEQ
jgi:hypothetical protein